MSECTRKPKKSAQKSGDNFFVSKFCNSNKNQLDFRRPPHLLANELSVLFSMSRSLREERNMQASEGVF